MRVRAHPVQQPGQQAGTLPVLVLTMLVLVRTVLVLVLVPRVLVLVLVPRVLVLVLVRTVVVLLTCAGTVPVTAAGSRQRVAHASKHASDSALQHINSYDPQAAAKGTQQPRACDRSGHYYPFG
jgi:hypothetical protein